MHLPRLYQQRAIDFGVARNLLLSDQMGLGKSLVSIEICKAVFSKYDAPALIICPKGIKLQWVDFLSNQDPQANISIACDDPYWLQHSVAPLDYLVIHYEALIKYNAILAKHKWSTIVLDEAHRIKNKMTRVKAPKSDKPNAPKTIKKPTLRTAAVKSLKAYRKVALTGTPFDNNPAEIWSILNWLDPSNFSSYWQFSEEFVVFDVDFLGYKSNPHLKDPKAFVEMLRPYMLRRTKAMVMPELPKMQITHVPIELGVTQRRAYDAIKNVKDMEVSFSDLSEPMFIQHALTKLVRLLQCASDPHGLDFVAPSAKLDWLQDWISDNPLEPVLIFSRYRKTAERAAKLVSADRLIMGGKSLETSLTASRPIVECRRIVATIAAAGEGYDLGHISTAIYIDKEWSSILMSQSQERIDRGGNTEPKQLIFLEAVNTVDELVTQALENKWSTKMLIDQFLTKENPNDVHIHNIV